MNVLLLEPEELPADGSAVRIRGRRFEHVRRVLRSEVGDLLRIGVLCGNLGFGRVVSLGDDHLDLRVDSSADGETGLHQPPPKPLPLTLVLALPRPKVLRRVVSAVATLGVPRVFLINAFRVDKAYWQSPLLGEDALRQALLLGLEQAVDTRLPQLHLRRRFKPFVEDELPALAVGTSGFALHPAAPAPCPPRIEGPATLAIGPEGGFLPYEVDKLCAAGFRPVHLGPRILRVETVLPWVLGRVVP
ncbi:MAG: 16S rRNA (uracil(1498)-N(3))-methyltransferase [Acidobacteria bacterium]|nr:16S rRNA (uracil(1498)-N(3))-methyltransferase [Acidobacteriota bacterium]